MRDFSKDRCCREYFLVSRLSGTLGNHFLICVTTCREFGQVPRGPILVMWRLVMKNSFRFSAIKLVFIGTKNKKEYK
jgi:hypothetical protein